MGCGGGEDDDTLPTVGPTAAAGGAVGVFGGYCAATLRDCYCNSNGNTDNKHVQIGTPNEETSYNWSRLNTNIMYGRTKITWELKKVGGDTTVAGNTYDLGGILSFVAEKVGDTYASTALCSWDNYTVGTDKYFYPSVLTSMGEDFYTK